MKGPFRLGYFLSGNGKEDWYKAWGNGWRFTATVVLALFLVSGIRSCFREPGNTSKPIVIALPWSHVGDVDQGAEQKVEQRRKWWQPIPYISVAAEARYFDGIETGFKGEVGIRWDF